MLLAECANPSRLKGISGRKSLGDLITVVNIEDTGVLFGPNLLLQGALPSDPDAVHPSVDSSI